MKKLILLLLLLPSLSWGQHIPKLSSAVSASDSVSILQYQVLALDARLTTCENAHADSTIAHKKQLKTVRRQRFWKGVKRGIGGTVIVEAVIILIYLIKP